MRVAVLSAVYADVQALERLLHAVDIEVAVWRSAQERSSRSAEEAGFPPLEQVVARRPASMPGRG